MIPQDLPYVPKHDFNSDEMAVLDEAFASVWATIRHHKKSTDVATEEDMKSSLRRLLFALASQGVKDPHTLRNLALFNSPLRDVLLERETKKASDF